MPSYPSLATDKRAPFESRAQCAALDTRDPLAFLRDRFVLPEGLVYLDGNSLGPLPKVLSAHLKRVIEDEWGSGLIRSWNSAGWIDLANRLGAKIAPLIGASPTEVVVADSTSINVFKLLAGALRARPGRSVIVSEKGNFPSDLYMAQGLVDLLDGAAELRYVESEPSPDAVAAATGDDTAVVMLTHVDYRSGRMHDMSEITARVQSKGSLMLWDLAHSVGAVPLELGNWGVDLAVGCSYKYLNGGPGAPAFLYVAQGLQPRMPAVLSGWLGHAAPFEFGTDYLPAEGIQRQICGTPPVLSMAALDAALGVWEDVDLRALRRKSIALSELFIELIERRIEAPGLRLASPRDGRARGSQVSYHFDRGHAVMQALIDRDVIGDFRAPDIMRFGFAPLYLRYVDIWDAVEHLREVLTDGSWNRPEYRLRGAVT